MTSVDSYGPFKIYKDDSSSSFLYVRTSNPDLFMEGLADYIVSESSLLNYANSITPIEFTPTPKIYNKLYRTIGMFLNSQLELIPVDKEAEGIRAVLKDEFQFTSKDSRNYVQTDKIGKIGEYIFHLLMTNYYRIPCIIPKINLVTDRNMSVFGIDALFYNLYNRTLFFGESKVCNSIENAITLINRSFSDYENQISEEYRLVLSNEYFNLAPEFQAAFEQYTGVCMTFKDFIEAAKIRHICIPAFIAHGNSSKNNTVQSFLDIMNRRINKAELFGIDTQYMFISLPIINKKIMMSKIMRKVVEKSNEYRNATSKL